MVTSVQILLDLLRKREPIKWSNVHHLVIIDEKILYLTPEQEKDKSHFTDKEVSVTIHTGFCCVVAENNGLISCAFLRRGRNMS